MTDAGNELSTELDDADVNLIDDAGDGGDTDDSDAGEGSEAAPTAASVLDLLVTSLVDDADAVTVDAIEQRDKVRLEVRVAEGELGRVIGKRGRTATAIRTVVRAAAVRDDVRVDVEFED